MSAANETIIAAQHELIKSLKRENAELKRELERTSYHLEAARAERQDRDNEANALSRELENTRGQVEGLLEKVFTLTNTIHRLELEANEARGTIADKQTAYNIQRHMAQRHAARAAQAIAALEAIGWEFAAAAFEPTTPDSE